MPFSALGSQMVRFFGRLAEQTARETGFVQRRSKLTGSVFLKTVVFGFLAHPRAALEDLAEFCEDHVGVEVTRQGIHDRIGESAVEFLKHMFSQALSIFQATVPIPLPVLEQFSEVNIADSSTIELPPGLADIFPGSGGAASKSALKLQVGVDVLTGGIKRIDLTPGTTPDQRYGNHLEEIKAHSLNLFDLGYFTLENLKHVWTHNAYFLTRFLWGTALSSPHGQRLDLVAWVKGQSDTCGELTVRVGATLQLPCRLFFFRVPQKVAEERRRKAKRNAQRKGRTLSKATLEGMNWTLLLSNVPASMMALTHVRVLYTLRWQIELIFKLWKSSANLDEIAGRRKERVLCDLYAKFIGLVLFQSLVSPVRAEHLDLSLMKAFKCLTKQSAVLAQATRSPQASMKALKSLYVKLCKWAKQDKRRKRLSTIQTIYLLTQYPLLT